MKKINTYILEKLHINTATKIEYMYHPKDKDELIDCIKEKIEKEGLGTKDKPLNLNDIDTSKIIDMNYLFCGDDGSLVELSKTGYFDISDWNVSSVRDMRGMFYCSGFNGDISDWDVSEVRDMQYMFARSRFDGKNSNISDWNVSNVENMQTMFGNTKFNMNISNWNVNKVKNMKYMFYDCPLEKNPPKWYKDE